MSDISIPQKRCSHCHNFFDATPENFYRCKSRKDGLANYCKACDKSTRSQRYFANPEQDRLSRQKRRPEINARVMERYHSVPKFKALMKTNAKTQYWKDVELSRQKQREYARTHSKEAVARAKKWAQDNPLEYRTWMNNRYAREKAAVGQFTYIDYFFAYEDQEGRCAYCGQRLFLNIKNDIHVDHVIPLAKGGTNWPENIVLACKNCNSSKSDKLLSDWLLTRGW